jgi:hypothetical protein
MNELLSVLTTNYSILVTGAVFVITLFVLRAIFKKPEQHPRDPSDQDG